MINHELFAVSFARTVHLMRRQPPDVAQQKSALRAVYALTSIAPAVVRGESGRLVVDDVTIPAHVPHASDLVSQLTAHGVHEVRIARGASPADLLALVRALAVEAGGFAADDSVERRVRNSGSVAVLSVRAAEERPEEHRAASVTRAFERAGLEEAARAAGVAEPATALPDSMAGQGPRELDLGVEPGTGVEESTGIEQSAAPAEAEAQGQPGSPVEPPPAAVVAAEPADLPVPADSPLGRALLALRREPYAMHVLDTLTDLSHAFAEAVHRGDVQAAVRAAAAAIMLEPDAPEGTPRNSYAIVLKRMLTKENVAQIAPLLLLDADAAPASFVLQRAGPVAADVLLEKLAAAESPRERRAYMNAMRGIPSGTDMVVHMLDRREWYVVRNVAELCGELRLEEAVPDLGRLLQHSDTRVQRAAATALARIGSNATVTPLLKLLKDGTKELRGLVAASIGLRAAPALAMPIAALANEESNPDLLREYYRALGRIGTSDAVQVLVKASEPGGLFSRKPTAVRLAAVDGLKLAPPSATIAVLEVLSRDKDASVAGAARSALEAGRAGIAPAG